MIQFLQDQIQTLKPYRHKVLHQATVKDDLNAHHQQLMNIVNSSKQSIALDELQIEEEKDELLLKKLDKMRELQEKQKQLHIAVLKKSRLMKECQLNQVKLRKNREIYNLMQTKIQTGTIQKDKLTRQIKQNQLFCERARLENQDLRNKCEEEIKLATSEKVNKEVFKAQTVIRSKIQENLTIISKLVNLTELLPQKCKQMSNSHCEADALRVIELTRQLQLQNSQNFILKGQLKCEQIKYFQLSSKHELLSKVSQVRQAMIATFDQQQQNISSQIVKERAKRDQMQAKLTQYKKIKKQLEEVYGKLSTHYDTCKYSDFHGVKEMNKTSYRMERNISQQRHFLLERYSIVDSYRKYLRNN